MMDKEFAEFIELKCKEVVKEKHGEEAWNNMTHEDIANCVNCYKIGFLSGLKYMERQKA